MHEPPKHAIVVVPRFAPSQDGGPLCAAWSSSIQTSASSLDCVLQSVCVCPAGHLTGIQP